MLCGSCGGGRILSLIATVLTVATIKAPVGHRECWVTVLGAAAAVRRSAARLVERTGQGSVFLTVEATLCCGGIDTGRDVVIVNSSGAAGAVVPVTSYRTVVVRTLFFGVCFFASTGQLRSSREKC